MGTYPLDGDFVASAVNDSCPGPSGPAAEKKIKTAAEEVDALPASSRWSFASREQAVASIEACFSPAAVWKQIPKTVAARRNTHAEFTYRTAIQRRFRDGLRLGG